MSSIHKNSERPAYYTGWVAIPDLFLPAKGTAYRANKHDDQTIKAADVSEICGSDLWRLQGVAFDQIPSALPEQEFKVPSAKAHFGCQDGRKNLSDLQETSQWVAGESVANSLLKSLLGHRV